MRALLTSLIVSCLVPAALGEPPPAAVPVAEGINRFGLALHQRLVRAGEASASSDGPARKGNLVVSPWSIESALAMTWAGATGRTRDEMRTVLHLPADPETTHTGFAAIAAELETLARQSRARVDDPQRRGGPNTALELTVANRLFGQEGVPFEKPFLATLERHYRAPLEPLDFAAAPEPSRVRINHWVAERTRGRIRDLIPVGLITQDTRLVLANAIHLKAAWEEEFQCEPRMPFRIGGTQAAEVDGLFIERHMGHRPIPGGQWIAIPYADAGLQFLILLPDQADGLAALEASLTPELLTQARSLPTRKIRLHLPEFKLEPPAVLLGKTLVAMGMPSAFDQPTGSADFSGMAPRRPDDSLFLGEVVHRAFLAVDRHGTEAAAATAVVMLRSTALPVPEASLELRVDRPFLFAIQHTRSGACLFLGRVCDPRRGSR